MQYFFKESCFAPVSFVDIRKRSHRNRGLKGNMLSNFN